MAKIGYARVSTDEDSLDLQIGALEAAGCDRIYQDHANGIDRERPKLAEAISSLEPGDSIVVWKLDRLGRSVAHLVGLVDGLRERGIELVALTEGIDTTTPEGKVAFKVIAAMASMERDLIAERMRSGIAAVASSARRRIGRPPKVTPAKSAAAKSLYESGKSLGEIADALSISISSVKRALQVASF